MTISLAEMSQDLGQLSRRRYEVAPASTTAACGEVPAFGCEDVTEALAADKSASAVLGTDSVCNFYFRIVKDIAHENED